MDYYEDLSTANLARVQRWHPDFLTGGKNAWSGADWSNAMCGEAGEAANIVKKMRRYETELRGVGDPSLTELKEMLAEELADVTTYLDLLAQYYNIDLQNAIKDKFNKVSEKQGFPERLV